MFLVAEPITFPSGGGKSFIMGSDDVLLSVLGLGELADLTVANDADYSYDVSTVLLLDPIVAHSKNLGSNTHAQSLTIKFRFSLPSCCPWGIGEPAGYCGQVSQEATVEKESL